MKVCIVSPFFIDDKNISRPAFIRDTLVKKSVDVQVITSNFSHQLKEIVSFEHDKISTVKTIKYSRNNSPVRFISHFFLSFGLFLKAFRKSKDVDIFYVTAPFAITALLIKFFSRKKVIIDIIDYWPNSLPFKRNVLTFPFLKLWQIVNFTSCYFSDKVISLSTTFLKLAKRDANNQILFGTKRNFIPRFTLSDEKVGIIYIGNVGALYDFESLLYVFEKNPKRFRFDLIGCGDRLEWLENNLNRIGVEYNFHGVIYDSNLISEIVKGCHFGFNGYQNTNASFSYKALSYFSYGLPIINSMNGDLSYFVTKYGLGLNYTQGCKLSLEQALLSHNLSSFDNMNVREFFDNFLDEKLIEEKIIKVFEELYDKKII